MKPEVFGMMIDRFSAKINAGGFCSAIALALQAKLPGSVSGKELQAAYIVHLVYQRKVKPQKLAIPSLTSEVWMCRTKARKALDFGLKLLSAIQKGDDKLVALKKNYRRKSTGSLISVSKKPKEKESKN